MSFELVLASSIITFLAIVIPSAFLATKFLGVRNSGNIAKNTSYESGITKPVGGARVDLVLNFT